MGLVFVPPPASEPLSLADAKAHLRVTVAAEDSLITALIVSARELVEAATGRALISQTLALVLDAFPPWRDPLWLPRPPLATLTSVVYTDSAGDPQTWDAANYAVDDSGFLARIVPVDGVCWPATAAMLGAVVVTYDAGYGDAADVPASLVAALKLIVATLYEQRQETAASVGVLGAATRSLLAPYVVQPV